MSDFEPIFDKVLDIEGGYMLHKVKGDRGGMTYAGIARNRWSKWEGWVIIDQIVDELGIDIDKKSVPLVNNDLRTMVKIFFKQNFWDKIWGDQIGNSKVAYHIYAFAVNAGLSNAVKITQRIIGTTVDGAFGPKTFKSLNQFVRNEDWAEIFSLKFSLEKVFRYNYICREDKRRKQDRVISNLKFMSGWINRVKKGLDLCE